MKFKKIYFVGIKGVGMTSLAIIAKQAGFEVAGSDVEEEFITDEVLKKERITPLLGFNSSNIEGFFKNSEPNEVLVIATAAHGGFDNPEAKFATHKNIKLLTHGQAVGYYMEGQLFGRSDIEGISIAGAHGKTTTSAMVATFLSKLGFDPSYTIGTSEIFPLGAAGHYGKGKYFVAEADEYSSELKYDRKPKFLYQYPKIVIINNVDFDHPDFYKNIQDVEKSFEEFIKNVKASGLIIINEKNEKLARICQESGCGLVTFGEKESSDYYISSYRQSGFTSYFKVFGKVGFIGSFKLKLPGIHNARNAIGAISMLLELGIPVEKIKKTLPTFLGTKRRIQKIGEIKNGSIIIDDYAHHPKEINATLNSVKLAYPKKKIVCVFQAHTFSRTKALISEFVKSFKIADMVIIIPTYASLRDVVSDYPDDEFVHELSLNHPNVKFLKETNSVVKYILEYCSSDDFVVLTMGAGDVYKIAYTLKEL